MLNKFREKLETKINNIAKIFIKIGIPPWIVSLTGLVIIIISSIILLIDRSTQGIIISLVIFLIGNAMDALDGPIARLTGKTSKWGGITDSTLDKIGETIYPYTLGYTGIAQWSLIYIYIVTAILISYLRARGEAEGIYMRGIGLMERAERIISLTIILLLYALTKIDINVMLTILIILNIVTMIQRTYYLHQSLSES